MGIRSSIFNSNKAPRALILFLALAVVFEIGVVHWNCGPDYRWRKQLVRKTPIEADALFLGDSSSIRGVDTALFEKMTGRSVFVFGAMRKLGLLSYYLLLLDYLNHHPTPRTLVLMLLPITWDVEVGNHYWHEFDNYFHGDPLLFHALGEAGLRPDLLFRYFVLSRLPTMARRPYLKDMVFADRRALFKAENAKLRTQGKQIIEKGKGALLVEATSPAFLCRINKKEVFGISRESRVFLRKILDKARAYGIDVYYVSAPVARECLADWQVKDLDETNRRIQQEFPEMRPLQPELLLYPKDSFSDTGGHLKRSEAVRLTTGLAEALERSAAQKIRQKS
ncbi:MAG: hypothetical protein A2Y02_00845 [Omnitrophica bacterium GWA2_52_12]|nr:MAG: hypothetical protein A2Y02_00845 [Omnitrophica bacterium GWA2_52_12]